MKMDGAEAKAKTSAQQAMAVKLDALGSDAQSWQSLVDPLLSSVPLSDKQSERMDARFVAESNYYLDSMQMVDGELWDEEERLRQNISRDLRNTSYSSALSTAATLCRRMRRPKIGCCLPRPSLRQPTAVTNSPARSLPIPMPPRHHR